MKTENEKIREWFVVPPYGKQVDWEIIDDEGEIIATVEDKNDAKDIVKLHNQNYGYEK